VRAWDGQDHQADGEDRQAREADSGQVLAEQGQPEDRCDGRFGQAERGRGRHRGRAQPSGVEEVGHGGGEHGEVAGHREAAAGRQPFHGAQEQAREQEDGRAAEDGADDGAVVGAMADQMPGRGRVDRVAEAGEQRQGDTPCVGAGRGPAGGEQDAAGYRGRRRDQPAHPGSASPVDQQGQDAGEHGRAWPSPQATGRSDV